MHKAGVCNICGSLLESSFIALSDVPPLQNRLCKTRDDALNFPSADMGCYWCPECQHISIQKSLHVKFDEHYDNRQTFSALASRQFELVAKEIEAQLPDREAHIVEVGCGHGELLALLNKRGYRNLKGFDPAAPASEDNIYFRSYWTGSDTDVDLIIFRHTLEEIPEVDEFVELVANSLSDGGLVYCEITNAPLLMNGDGLFSLYPEYANLFSAASVSRLFARHKLSVEMITSINDGEWLGIWARKNIGQIDGDLQSVLGKLKQRICKLPRPVVLWGVAGKGMNILAFLKLTRDEIQYSVDLNKAKQGMFVPPYGQEVISPDQLQQIDPKTILVANSKYKSEISQMAPVGCDVLTMRDIFNLAYLRDDI